MIKTIRVDNIIDDKIYFYYLKMTYHYNENELLFTVVSMSKKYFKDNYKEFHHYNKGEEKINNNVSVDSFGKFKTERMIIMSEDNISVGKNILIKLFYNHIEKRIDELNGYYLYNLNNLNKTLNSKIFRNLKIDKILNGKN